MGESPLPRATMTLEELGVLHGTDKGTWHEYWPLYTSELATLKDAEFTLIEIGVWHGASMKVWSDYFPKARIIGLDNSPLVRSLPGVELYEMDAMHLHETELFRSLSGDVVLIDDGCHVLEQQAVCAARLSSRCSKYFVEDCAQNGDGAMSIDILSSILRPAKVYDVRAQTGRYDDLIIYKS